jgi:hypothetical protein
MREVQLWNCKAYLSFKNIIFGVGAIESQIPISQTNAATTFILLFKVLGDISEGITMVDFCRIHCLKFVLCGGIS